MATPTPPLPRMELAGMLAHPAPRMAAPAEMGATAAAVQAVMAAMQQQQPLPRLQVAILQLHQVMPVRAPVVPVLTTARPLTGLPVRPTQHQAQRLLGRAKLPPKRRSITAPALALLWRQARRVRVLGEACRHPLPLL